MFQNLFGDKKKIPFSSFVDYALYSSKGYYKKESMISKQGDFLTSPNISKVYAQTLANFLVSKGFNDYFRENNESTDVINLIELGSHEGILMKDIVDYLKTFYKTEIYDKIKLVIVEKNLNLHENIFKQLSNHKERLLVTDSLSSTEINSKKAIIFCNEFLDALPFERCVIKEDKLYQINVEFKDGKFIESLDEANLNLEKKIKEYKLNSINNYFFEIAIEEYEKLFQTIIDKFSKVFFLTSDYGEKSDYFHCSPDPFGTSRCFFRHSVNRNFYENIFNQDITYDINFMLLSIVAKRFNLIEDGFFSQTNFFINNDWNETPAFLKLSHNDLELAKVNKLIHPNSMGERFKFIAFKL